MTGIAFASEWMKSNHWLSHDCIILYPYRLLTLNVLYISIMDQSSFEFETVHPISKYKPTV
jgi:hypothetical protein